MKEAEKDEQPQPVRKLERGGEIRARWSWVEPSVWTDRMLESLEGGVKGGKWHSLIDKVFTEKNLEIAWKRVRERGGCAGIDKMSIELFAKRADKRIARLSEQLREGSYEPRAVKRVWIPKGGGKLRGLGVPTIIDRVVQTSLKNAIEPIFEQMFEPSSYGFRPGRGCKDALREVAARLEKGQTWVVEVDIEKYFDTIDKKRLMSLIAEQIADGSVLGLIEQFLDQEVMEGLDRWRPEAGTPQGAVISPLLANIYLHPVDVAMRSHGYVMIRYADDMVVMCRSREEADRALATLTELLEECGLRLHPEKTGVVDASERPGFEFLGYQFFGNRRYPRESSRKKLRDNIRSKTPKLSGDSIEVIIKSVNATLRGWFGYFKHSSSSAFISTDKWVRMRIRRILRKRSKRNGQARGHDHLRWPNAHLQQLGLFSLHEAHKLVRQSSS